MRFGSCSAVCVAVVEAAAALGFAMPAAAAALNVRTVRWSAADASVPHDTWSGAAITLKGVSSVAGPQITATWDFGDGSDAVTGAVSTNTISAVHQYSGQPGTIFKATLTVVDATSGERESAVYTVAVREKSLASEVNVAIDEGLWQLYERMRTTQMDERTTALAVLAFERNGHLDSGNPADPYTEAVSAGLQRLIELKANDCWASSAIRAAGSLNTRTSTGRTYRQILDGLAGTGSTKGQARANESPEERLLDLAQQGAGRADARWATLESQIRDRNDFNVDAERLLALSEAMRLQKPAPIQYMHSAAGLGDLDWYAAQRSLGDTTDGVARTILNQQRSEGGPRSEPPIEIARRVLTQTRQPLDSPQPSVNNVTGQINVNRTALVFNRISGTYNTTLTLANTTGGSIPGPLTLGLPNLTATVTLANSGGTFNGDPYIAIQSGALDPFASVNLALQFNNPPQGPVSFTPTIYSGSFPPGSLQLTCPAGTATVGTAYDSFLTATGAVQPYTFSVSIGSLPHNLTLDPTTGEITGMPDEAEDPSFTGSVDDSSGGTPQNTTVGCSINVTEPNHPPVAEAQSPSTNENAALPLTLTGTDADGDPLTFAIGTGPSNGTLGSFSGLACSGNPSTCTVNVTYTPSNDYNGSDSFTFKVNDGKADSNIATVSITVNFVNQTPSFTKGSDVTVSDAAGAQTVSHWATNLNPGAPNESSQILSFIVSNNNTSLFSVQPAIDSSGTLTFTPATGVFGSALVSVQIHDNGGTSNGGSDTSAIQTFTITTTLTTTGSFVDTTQADFQAGTPTNLDLNTSPGDVLLAAPTNIDQQNVTLGTSGVGITTTTWGGQTFTPSVSGTLTRADINLFCSGCTGTTPNLTLSLRATSGGLPTGADLASATITGFNNGAAVFYTATFGAPPTLTAGTQYALVIRPTANPSPGTYALTRSGTATAGSDVYAGGTRVSGATSGTVWSIPLTGGVSTDAGFKTYVFSGYSSSGDLISTVKDSAPGAGTTTWSSISWTATTPANTSVQFQVAASNSATGPFTFVGPDGTNATFFTTSGASLAEFDGFRYLEYHAFLATTDSTVSPTLSDVTINYSTLQ